MASITYTFTSFAPPSLVTPPVTPPVTPRPRPIPSTDSLVAKALSLGSLAAEKAQGTSVETSPGAVQLRNRDLEERLANLQARLAAAYRTHEEQSRVCRERDVALKRAYAHGSEQQRHQDTMIKQQGQRIEQLAFENARLKANAGGQACIDRLAERAELQRMGSVIEKRDEEIRRLRSCLEGATLVGGMTTLNHDASIEALRIANQRLVAERDRLASKVSEQRMSLTVYEQAMAGLRHDSIQYRTENESLSRQLHAMEERCKQQLTENTRNAQARIESHVAIDDAVKQARGSRDFWKASYDKLRDRADQEINRVKAQLEIAKRDVDEHYTKYGASCRRVESRHAEMLKQRNAAVAAREELEIHYTAARAAYRRALSMLPFEKQLTLATPDFPTVEQILHATRDE